MRPFLLHVFLIKLDFLFLAMETLDLIVAELKIHPSYMIILTSLIISCILAILICLQDTGKRSLNINDGHEMEEIEYSPVGEFRFIPGAETAGWPLSESKL